MSVTEFVLLVIFGAAFTLPLMVICFAIGLFIDEAIDNYRYRKARGKKK